MPKKKNKHLTDKQFLIECIDKAYDKCNNTTCRECEYQELGREVCEMNLLADYLMQNGFFRQCDRSATAPFIAEATKRCAEKIKQKTLAMVYSPDEISTEDYIKCVDDVVKEMEGE